MPLKKIVPFFTLFLCSFLLFACSQKPANSVTLQDSSSAEAQQPVVEPTGPFHFSEKVPAEGLSQKISDHITKQVSTQTVRGKSFLVAVQVIDKGLILLGALDAAYDKRYSDEQIKAEYLKQKAPIVGNVAITAIISHLGGSDDQNKITLDSNSYEYFFLENENGDYIKALSQQPLAIGTDEVSWLNEKTPLILSFSEAELENLMKNSQHLFLTFKGMKIMPNEKDNRVELKYPFSEYYKENFPQLATMLKEIES